MKGIRTAIAALAFGLVATVALTGCTSGGPTDEDYENYRQSQLSGEIEFIYTNVDTDEITKVTTYDGEVLFNENASGNDNRIEYENFGYGQKGSFESSITTTVEVDGKAYPISARVSWYIAPMTYEEQIALYNERIASPENTKLLASQSVASLLNTVGSSLEEPATEALKSLQFQPTGRSVTVADDRIIAGAAAGTPAWQVLQDINGSPVSSERYYYSYLCATYDVTIPNKEAVLDAIKSLPDADLMEGFNLGADKAQLMIETAQPCTIQAAAEPGDQKSSSNNNPNSGTYQPTPNTPPVP